MRQNEYRTKANNRTKTFRWFFYIAMVQFIMYFIVPLMIFPSKVIKDIEIVSALTLGLLVVIFFGLVNIIGLVLDKSRRVVYYSMLIIIVAYLIWAIISWSYIEHMDYILR